MPKSGKVFFELESDNIIKEESKIYKLSFDEKMNKKNYLNINSNVYPNSNKNIKTNKLASNKSHHHLNFRSDKKSTKSSHKFERTSRKSIFNSNQIMPNQTNYIKRGFNSFTRKSNLVKNDSNNFKFLPNLKSQKILNTIEFDSKLEVKNFQLEEKDNYKNKNNIKNNNNNQENSSKISKISSDNLMKNFKRSNKNIIKKITKDKIFDKKNIYSNNFCDICLSSFNLKSSQEEIITLECGHFYCKECIKLFIITSISKWNFKNNLENSKCPKPVCSKIISIKTIEFILKDDEENIKKFNKYKKILFMLEKPDEIIICPIPDCDSYAYRKKIERGFALCINLHKFCIKCNEEHINRSKKCRTLSEEEYSTEIYFKKNFDLKKCPQCFTMQHKFEDCRTNAVKCGYDLCNYEFCWLCLEKSEKNHYTNPLSSCYRLEKIDTKHVLATYNSLRMTKYFLIVLMLMLIIPFLIIFSTFLFVTFFILAFVPDGSAVKHIKMKRKGLEPIFKICVSGIYFFIAVSLIPCGYIIQSLFIILFPFILCYNKFSSLKMEYF